MSGIERADARAEHGVVDLRGTPLDEEIVAAARVVVWTLTRELPHRRWAILDRVGHVVAADDGVEEWRGGSRLAQVQLDDDDAWLDVVTDAAHLPADGIESVAARALARLLLAVVGANRRARQAEQAADRAWWVASIDPVTRVLNARGWWDRVEDIAAANPEGIAVGYFAIANLEAINDRHGHLHGDLVLRVAAERVTSQLGTGDVLARLGGASFIVLAHGTGVDELVERIGAAVAVDGVAVRVGAASRLPDEPLRATMARADLDFRDRPARAPVSG